ncbi:alpha/beta hydrolase fold domain-containing protein [Micromonospora sp. NPDC050686]|uniref:alpha/beta hydrolase n=1 Tax=Micromonospora sp. NPDC050686 TaxID=3154631 RepID=UPI0033D13768
MVPVLVHRPSRPREWVVRTHAVPWHPGSARHWAPVTASMSGWAVASVDYWLAPAHRFPAAVLDMLATLDWPRPEQRRQVVIGGDSDGALSTRPLRSPAVKPACPCLGRHWCAARPACASPSYPAAPGVFPDRAELRAAWRLWFDSAHPPRASRAASTRSSSERSSRAVTPPDTRSGHGSATYCGDVGVDGLIYQLHRGPRRRIVQAWTPTVAHLGLRVVGAIPIGRYSAYPHPTSKVFTTHAADTAVWVTSAPTPTNAFQKAAEHDEQRAQEQARRSRTARVSGRALASARITSASC